jgi:aconitate hydratase
MGVLPLEFADGQDAESLGLTGDEVFEIPLTDELKPRQQVEVRFRAADGREGSFETTCRIDTPVEIDYYRNGGILQTVLRGMM